MHYKTRTRQRQIEARLVGGKVFLRLEDRDHVREKRLRSDDALGVVGKHDRDLDSEDALPHHDVTDGGVDVLSVSKVRSKAEVKRSHS